jgi:integrase/recombinase XerD
LPKQWAILEKDTIDEIIFKTDNPRNRLRLELMARGGMRISEEHGVLPHTILAYMTVYWSA